ncbi:BREX-2 system adenine-specific DNA-methyltransferase PglX [Pirellulaceae bacterium SH501]
MIDVKTILPELRSLVHMLAEDLLVQAEQPQFSQKLRSAYDAFFEEQRISQSYEEWREDYLDQVAVAWVLACVFVRFIEDNGLLDECWLAGEGDRHKLAEGSYELFFRQNPYDTDREYLKFVFREIGKIPAARELFEEGKTALWAVDPSGDAARKLLNYFKELNAEAGGLKRSFATRQSKTGPIVEVYEKLAPQAQFLGDLYQDLSEHARKKYALLQTPEFIQQFILDRTLGPAIDEFGLKGLRLIDPACGSGHFLLGAFDRLFEEWMKPEYGVNNPVVAAQNALDSIHGTDLNPFAIAITRFRLLVAAIQACKISRLHQQSYAWKLNLATGDSLLWGSKPGFNAERVPIAHQQRLFDVDPILAVENPAELNRILGQGYHVVVGNPPYITVKDKSQNEAYRKLFPQVCHRKYSLGVPFTQKFWELAIRKGEEIAPNSNEVAVGAGYVGMITANSFMKREFGKKLIEDFFPKHDLTHVIDTSGAYIPGHGTPTVILFGRSRKPIEQSIRTVMGIKGEPATPADPAKGHVWLSILERVDIAFSENDFVSTSDVPRSSLAQHPWSIGGGGASDLKQVLDDGAGSLLSSRVLTIGFGAILGEEEAFSVPRECTAKLSCDVDFIRPLMEGELVRDWGLDWNLVTLFPYDSNITLTHSPKVLNYLWPWRTLLSSRPDFSKRTYAQAGRPHWEYHQIPKDRYKSPLSITFAAVATHNHFVLDRGGKVFKQSAPIIKLPVDCTEEEHLCLLGPLNSSLGCFWMKQVFFPKGGDHVGQEGARVRRTWWDERYDHAGTQLLNFPLPKSMPSALPRKLDCLASELRMESPENLAQREVPTDNRLSHARAQTEALTAQMIAYQEELDWLIYSLYGILTEDLTYSGDLPNVSFGQRAFEICMARQIERGDLETTWFERHGCKGCIEVPSHWPVAYRSLIERRIKVIETNKEISLVEKPEYKRRWNRESWEERKQRALKNWLLQRLEGPHYQKGTLDHPELTTTAQLADSASADTEFLQVAAIYRGRHDFDLASLVSELVEAESIPLSPVLRYKPSGLRKREVWERIWDCQRKQDRGEDLGEIPVPPKYATADFIKTDFWRLRGKLDVPKERWISFPHCSTDSDPSLVVFWAGYNHLQQATALIAYYDARKREGWDAKRLIPLLAGLDQLLPWIHQWHPEVDSEFGETAGQSFQTLLEHDAHELGLTMEDIRNWLPPAKPAKAAAKRPAKPRASRKKAGSTDAEPTETV